MSPSMVNGLSNVEFVTPIPLDLFQFAKVARVVNGSRGARVEWMVPSRDYKPKRERGAVLTMWDVALDYIEEHCIGAGVDPQRAWGALEDWLYALGPDRDAATLARADGRLVVDRILARGCTSATARRIMTFGNAALNHARKEERLTKVPHFQMPARSESRVRWLSREEHRLLMQRPMPPRLYRFFLLAFGTGARSEAIEELTWDQVDLAQRTINYAKEGVVYKNKRRALVPISDDLYPRIVRMHERRTDDYVIGLGPRGACSTTYHQAKAALKAVGIDEEGVARHVARHTFASWLLQNGVSIYEVAKLIGDTVAMVERVYGHLQPKHLLGAINRLH